MEDKRKSTCWIGLHTREIHKELDLTNLKGDKVGLVIISRCTHCGSIKEKKIKTVDNSYA